MITVEEINKLAKAHKINQATILREYLQVWFLSQLYFSSQSTKIFFKGGTALHLIYKTPRFSEDLDFTVETKQKEFEEFINYFFKKTAKLEQISYKERKTLTGKRYLLTSEKNPLNFSVFINLDFSFREKVFEPQKSIIETDYSVLFNSYVYHLSQNEILAEKIRAVMTREQGRDIYDLWHLFNIGARLDQKLIKEKLKYYKIENFSGQELLVRIKSFSKKAFVLDMRPFVPVNERDNLGIFFDYITDFLERKIGREQ